MVLENCDVALAAVLRLRDRSHQPPARIRCGWGGPGVDDEVDGVRCLGMPRAQSNEVSGNAKSPVQWASRTVPPWLGNEASNEGYHQ